MNAKSTDLKDKVVVITGASSGFGRGAALRFTKLGARCVIAARRTEVLEKLAEECQTQGGEALPVTADVSRPADVEKIGEAALGQYGRIDVWINNAGVGALGPFEDIPLEENIKVIETDLIGTVAGSHVALKQFKEQGHGILINVASLIGKVPTAYYGAYTAAKYGVVGLSAGLRQELRQNNIDTIRVCTVMPQSHDTPWFEHAANYTGHEVQALPPVNSAEDVIETFVHLALNPEDEIVVGAAGKAMSTLHAVFPALAEKMLGAEARKKQMTEAPAAGPTSGAVLHPTEKGTGVSGGRRSP